jgi:hypothetical protein
LKSSLVVLDKLSHLDSKAGTDQVIDLSYMNIFKFMLVFKVPIKQQTNFQIAAVFIPGPY